MPIHHIEAILACREALDRLEQENKVMVDGPNEGLEGVMVYEIVDDAGANREREEVSQVKGKLHGLY